MSTTYDIACRDCKVKLWIGQSSCDNPLYIYGGEHLEEQAQFYSDHQDHPLVFKANCDGAETEEWDNFQVQRKHVTGTATGGVKA